MSRLFWIVVSGDEASRRCAPTSRPHSTRWTSITLQSLSNDCMRKGARLEPQGGEGFGGNVSFELLNTVPFTRTSG